jgi:hypothetical protein
VHPLPQRRFRQVELARDGPDRLALVEDEADGLGFELRIELSPRSSA